MIECTNCKSEINQNYCPNCGQKFINKRISLTVWLADLIDSGFSLNNSFWLNFRLLLLNPQKMISDYWNGFRNFYFSPGKHLIIAAVALGINFIFFPGKFLGLTIGAVNFSAQLGFILLLIPIFSLASYLTYFRLKKNLVEHIVMNSYNIGLWLFIFSIVSMLINLFETGYLNYPSLLLFLILTAAWNSRSFKLSALVRFLYCLTNIIVLSVIIGSIIYILILGGPG